jgi:hypothetical protein
MPASAYPISRAAARAVRRTTLGFLEAPHFLGFRGASTGPGRIKLI